MTVARGCQCLSLISPTKVLTCILGLMLKAPEKCWCRVDVVVVLKEVECLAEVETDMAASTDQAFVREGDQACPFPMLRLHLDCLFVVKVGGKMGVCALVVAG